VEREARFPNLLVAALGQDPQNLTLVANLGRNGFTSRQLIDIELPALDALKPQFVTVLIGVNDVVQRVDPADYQANVVAILDDLLARLPPERILTVAIPDYTVTPQGAGFGDPAVQSGGIGRNNATIARLALERGIVFADIHDIALRAGNDPSLVANDGLHPSGAQYALWVERIVPMVRGLLGR